MKLYFLRDFLILVLLSINGYAQNTPNDCPSSLGDHPYGGTTYKQYFCIDRPDQATQCQISKVETKVHRSYYGSTTNLSFCSTEFCLQTTYYLSFVNAINPANSATICLVVRR